MLLSPVRPAADCAENVPFVFWITEQVAGVIDTTVTGSPELVLITSGTRTPTAVFAGVAKPILCWTLAPGRGAFIPLTVVENVREVAAQYECPAKVAVK
jgi:hypothetical protein